MDNLFNNAMFLIKQNDMKSVTKGMALYAIYLVGQLFILLSLLVLAGILYNAIF